MKLLATLAATIFVIYLLRPRKREPEMLPNYDWPGW